jgi:hypothetical protein
MIFAPGLKSLKGGLVGRRLGELGQQLQELSRRVREAVAQAIREAVAQLARDTVDRFLPRQRTRFPLPHRLDDGDYEFDPWEVDEEEPPDWDEPKDVEADQPVVASRPAAIAQPVARSAVALGLAAAGWWLRRRSSVWAALGIGLFAGAAAAMTGRLAEGGLALVQAAHDLLTYRHAVSSLALP